VWLTLLGVAVAEVVLTMLIPLPGVVHTCLAALGAWGIVIVVGIVAALVVHPHVVGPAGVRLRVGFWDEIRLARRAVETVVVTPPIPAPRGLAVAGGEATLTAGGATNIELRLRVPVVVAGALVTRVRTWADDPAALSAALRA
jgi:hypothetical protein